MSAANSWKTHLINSLEKNLASSGSAARFAALATVRPDKTPAVRTVVMRGFAGESSQYATGWSSNLLLLTTDKKTDKMNEIALNPNVELNWFMNGTYEQYRISGTAYPIEKDASQCKLDKQDNPIKTLKEASLTPEPLSLQAFLKRQKGDEFDWEAERLRQFMEFESNLRAELISSKEKRLEIPSISESGWFQNQEYQDLLDESFDNFVLLIIKVTSVVYWSPSTGIIKQL